MQVVGPPSKPRAHIVSFDAPLKGFLLLGCHSVGSTVLLCIWPYRDPYTLFSVKRTIWAFASLDEAGSACIRLGWTHVHSSGDLLLKERIAQQLCCQDTLLSLSDFSARTHHMTDAATGKNSCAWRHQRHPHPVPAPVASRQLG